MQREAAFRLPGEADGRFGAGKRDDIRRSLLGIRHGLFGCFGHDGVILAWRSFLVSRDGAGARSRQNP